MVRLVDYSDSEEEEEEDEEQVEAVPPVAATHQPHDNQFDSDDKSDGCSNGTPMSPFSSLSSSSSLSFSAPNSTNASLAAFSNTSTTSAQSATTGSVSPPAKTPVASSAWSPFGSTQTFVLKKQMTQDWAKVSTRWHVFTPKSSRKTRLDRKPCAGSTQQHYEKTKKPDTAEEPQEDGKDETADEELEEKAPAAPPKPSASVGSQDPISKRLFHDFDDDEDEIDDSESPQRRQQQETQTAHETAKPKTAANTHDWPKQGQPEIAFDRWKSFAATTTPPNGFATTSKCSTTDGDSFSLFGIPKLASTSTTKPNPARHLHRKNPTRDRLTKFRDQQASETAAAATARSPTFVFGATVQNEVSEIHQPPNVSTQDQASGRLFSSETPTQTNPAVASSSANPFDLPGASGDAPTSTISFTFGLNMAPNGQHVNSGDAAGPTSRSTSSSRSFGKEPSNTYFSARGMTYFSPGIADRNRTRTSTDRGRRRKLNTPSAPQRTPTTDSDAPSTPKSCPQPQPHTLPHPDPTTPIHIKPPTFTFETPAKTQESVPSFTGGVDNLESNFDEFHIGVDAPAATTKPKRFGRSMTAVQTGRRRATLSPESTRSPFSFESQANQAPPPTVLPKTPTTKTAAPADLFGTPVFSQSPALGTRQTPSTGDQNVKVEDGCYYRFCNQHAFVAIAALGSANVTLTCNECHFKFLTYLNQVVLCRNCATKLHQCPVKECTNALGFFSKGSSSFDAPKPTANSRTNPGASATGAGLFADGCFDFGTESKAAKSVTNPTAAPVEQKSSASASDHPGERKASLFEPPAQETTTASKTQKSTMTTPTFKRRILRAATTAHETHRTYFSSNGSQPARPTRRASPFAMDNDWCKLKEQGGRAYSGHEYSNAADFYRQSIDAIEVLIETHQLIPAICHKLLQEKAKLHANRSASLMMLSKWKEALRECELAIEVDPLYVRAHLRLARLLVFQGDAEVAHKRLKEVECLLDTEEDHATALKLAKEADQLIKLVEIAKWYQGLKDWEEVLTKVDKALAIAPNCRALHLQKTRTLLNQKNPHGVIKFCNDLMQRNGSTFGDELQVDVKVLGVELSLLVARSWHYLSEYDKATAYVEALEAYAPCSNQVVGVKRLWADQKALKHEANDCFKRGAYSHAVDVYSKALKLDRLDDKHNAVLYCNRAAALMGLKKYDQAFKDCDEALKRDQNYARGRLRRARCLVALMRYKEAVKDFDAYLTLAKDQQHDKRCNGGDSVEEVEKERLEAHLKAQELKRAQAKREQQARAEQAQSRSRAKGKAQWGEKGWWRNTQGRYAWDDSTFAHAHAHAHGNSSSYSSSSRGSESAGAKSKGGWSYDKENSNRRSNRNGSSSSSSATRSHYEVLGLTRSASSDEIRKAYRRLALMYHPDKVKASDATKYADLFKDMTAAYNVLSDVKARQKYDRELLFGGFGKYYEY